MALDKKIDDSGEFALFVITTGRSGFLWGIGGTVGSVIATLMQLLFCHMPWPIVWNIALAGISLFLGFKYVEEGEDYLLQTKGPQKRHNNKIAYEDFQSTNIDEILGQTIASLPIFIWLFWAQANFLTLVALLTISCTLFRIFDIAKPWPVSKVEKINGAIGIMLDDVVAGIYAAILLSILMPFSLPHIIKFSNFVQSFF